MEPMALGSPPTSPLGRSQPGFPSAGTPNLTSLFQTQHSTSMASPGLSSLQPQFTSHETPGGYMPGYLMGDFAHQGTSSPAKLNRSLSNAPTMSTPVVNGTPSRDGFLTPTTPGPLRTPSEKPGGPPTAGLLISKGKGVGTPKFGTPKSYAGTPQGHTFSTPIPTTPQLSFGATPSHSTSVRDEIFNSSSAFSREDTWVTVFGFPPSAASFILSQFSQYGTILQHHIPTNGNWLHLKYQTKMQAQKALGKTNRILGGSIMIGVCPCTDPKIEDHLNISTSNLNRSYLTGGTALDDSSVTNLNSSFGGAKLNSSIRPLTQAYKAANVDNEISSTGGNTPYKNSGIVGKAMEYIFGW